MTEEILTKKTVSKTVYYRLKFAMTCCYLSYSRVTLSAKRLMIFLNHFSPNGSTIRNFKNDSLTDPVPKERIPPPTHRTVRCRGTLPPSAPQRVAWTSAPTGPWLASPFSQSETLPAPSPPVGSPLAPSYHGLLTSSPPAARADSPLLNGESSTRYITPLWYEFLYSLAKTKSF